MMKKQNLLSISIISFLLVQLIFLPTGQAINPGVISSEGYIDITVEEAWDLLNDIENGIQYPIDVRTNNEWKQTHIDTPYPEYPRHHNFYEWDDPEILQDFLTTYEGKEIIVYCRSGGRSASASTMLSDNGFNGIIYNMIGGITEWQSSGFPTVPNRPPETPDFSGPSIGTQGDEIEFTLTTTDPDYDTILYMINWSDGSDVMSIGPYDSNEMIVITHIWNQGGIYPIKVKAIDPYDAESEMITFDFSISKTELDITNIKGGLGSVIIDIKNMGDYVAEEITSEIIVRGGLFSRINLTHNCSGCDICGTTLEPGDIKTENTRETGFIMGFGSLDISVSASANNAEEVYREISGFVIGALIVTS